MRVIDCTIISIIRFFYIKLFIKMLVVTTITYVMVS